MTKKLRLFKGGRKDEDIYDRCKKDKAIDINDKVERYGSAPGFDLYGEEDEWLRMQASGRVREITDDPVDHEIADLMLDYGYTEKEVARILNISPARVEWFMRKIEGWKRMGRKK